MIKTKSLVLGTSSVILSAKTSNTNRMLITISLILIGLWLVGFLGFHILGSFIHALFIIAVILILLRIIRGRKLL